jgi:hypothetical protein
VSLPTVGRSVTARIADRRHHGVRNQGAQFVFAVAPAMPEQP